MKRDWGPSAPLNLRYAKNSKEQIVELLKKACALMRCHRFASDIFPLVAPVVCLPCEVDPAPPTVSEDAMCLQRLRHPHILSVIEATGLFGLYRSDKLSVHFWQVWAYKPILGLLRRSQKVHDLWENEALVEERSTLAFATKPVVGREAQELSSPHGVNVVGSRVLFGGSRCISWLPEKWNSTSNLRGIWNR